MELLELIFALVSKFSPIHPTALGKLESEGRQWRVDIEKEENRDKLFNKYYLKLNEQWYLRLLWALLFPVITRWLMTEHVELEKEQL